MEIKAEDYRITYNADEAQITCSGNFRLQGSDYAPIVDILNQAADAKPEQLTLDLRELKFLNSSGINMLSKFVIRIRKHGVSGMLVRGSNAYAWQGKSLKNLQRLKKDLVLELED